MSIKELDKFAALCHELKSSKIYINGILATKEDLAELERKLRLGIEYATAQCHNDAIYYKTV